MPSHFLSNIIPTVARHAPCFVRPLHTLNVKQASQQTNQRSHLTAEPAEHRCRRTSSSPFLRCTCSPSSLCCTNPFGDSSSGQLLDIFSFFSCAPCSTNLHSHIRHPHSQPPAIQPRSDLNKSCHLC